MVPFCFLLCPESEYVGVVDVHAVHAVSLATPVGIFHPVVRAVSLKRDDLAEVREVHQHHCADVRVGVRDQVLSEREGRELAFYVEVAVTEWVGAFIADSGGRCGSGRGCFD